MSEKLYDVYLYHVDEKTGERVYKGHNDGRKMNDYPMPHKKACKYKWAIDMNYKGIVYRLEEAKQC